jgi:hypothetical protein
MSSTISAPLLYYPALGSPAADENQVDTEIASALHKISEMMLKAGVHLRSLHAKSHGLLFGRLAVASALPAELAQGLFAAAATYPVIIRLSTVPGDIFG